MHQRNAAMSRLVFVPDGRIDADWPAKCLLALAHHEPQNFQPSGNFLGRSRFCQHFIGVFLAGGDSCPDFAPISIPEQARIGLWQNHHAGRNFTR